MTATTIGDDEPNGDSRRDFLYLATGALAAVGGGAALWPFLDNMNPSADVLALSTLEVDLAPIQPGQRITVNWRGQPVFVNHRMPQQIAAARADDGADLPDPVPDSRRAARPEWLVVVGICTHLGCVPLGQNVRDPKGDWGGWFCPCHGSQYDASGRVRKGPAPRNLAVPAYRFLNDTRISIG